MRIYTKVVIDIASMKVEDEESYEYSGKIAYCGGGGGASGEVDYPEYMKAQHHMWLNAGNPDGVLPAISDSIANAVWNNPHNEWYVYNPAGELSGMWSNGNRLDYLLSPMQVGYDYNDIVSYTKNVWNTLIYDTAAIEAVIDAFAVRYDEDLVSTVYPRFEAGMRDINAVQSSAFAIGRSIIETSRNTAVAAFDAETRLRAHFENGQTGISAIQNAYQLELAALGTKLDYTKAISHLLVDTGRLSIVANKEYSDGKIEERDAQGKWALEAFMYGGNMLASIGSASVQTGIKSNKAASAIGGALSGAAAGATVGSAIPGIGTAVGAVGGAVMGAAAGLLSG